MSEKKIVLHEMLRTLMARKGVSARAVCKATGIPQSTLQGFLDGKRESSIKHLPKLAAYFGCSIDFLLMGGSSEIERLEDLLTEDVFDGFLKVKIERVIRKGGKK